jgi:hypothetical protein
MHRGGGRLQSGVGLLRKPFSRAELIGQVRVVLDSGSEAANKREAPGQGTA